MVFTKKAADRDGRRLWRRVSGRGERAEGVQRVRSRGRWDRSWWGSRRCGCATSCLFPFLDLSEVDERHRPVAAGLRRVRIRSGSDRCRWVSRSNAAISRMLTAAIHQASIQAFLARPITRIRPRAMCCADHGSRTAEALEASAPSQLSPNWIVSMSACALSNHPASPRKTGEKRTRGVSSSMSMTQTL